MPVIVDSQTPESEKDLWRTPSPLFYTLNDEFRFHLDAAASPANTLCPLYFSRENSALDKERWGENGVRRVFCNPPFSMTDRFLGKGVEQYRHGGVNSVFLIRADGFETGWFRTHLLNHEPTGPYLQDLRFQIRLLWPRVPYVLPNGTKPKHGPNFPSALVVMFRGYQPGMFWYNWKKEAKDRGYLK